MGTRKKPFYRIVVADQRCSRDGRFIELLGNYDPRQDPPAINLDKEKAAEWLKNGAQPSDVVRSILARQGLIAPAVRPQGPAKPAAAPETPAPAPAPAASEAAVEAEAPQEAAAEAEAPQEASHEQPSEEAQPSSEDAAADTEETPSE